MADGRKATITAPDGRTATLNIPPGASDEQIRDAMNRMKAKLMETVPATASEATAEVAEAPAPEAPEEPKQPQRDIRERVLRGGGDIIMSGLTGLAGSVVGGYAGLWDLMTGGDVDTATRAVRGTEDFIGTDITDPDALAVLQKAAPVVQALEQWTDDKAYALASENPAAAAVIKGAVGGLVELTPLKFAKTGRRTQVREANRRIKKVQDRAARLGLDLDPTTIQQSVVDVANGRSGGYASASALIQDKLQAASRAERQVVKDMYENARAQPAYVPTRHLPGLADRIESGLAGYDIAEMGAVTRQLDTLRNMENRIPSSPRDMPEGQRLDFVELNEMDNVRKRINKRMNSIAGKREFEPEFKALGRVKRGIDDHMDHLFNTGAIHMANGADPMAVKRLWDTARKSHGEWAKRFDENKVIKDIIDGNGTVEDIRKWVVGASMLNSKPQAAKVINRIKELTGNEGEVMRAMRADYAFDLLEPLLREKPNFNAFNTNYKKLVEKNPSVVRALGGKEASAYRELNRAVRAIQNMPPTLRLSMDLNRIITTFMFGHGIAKRGLAVRTAKTVLDKVTRKDQVAKKHVLYEMAGIKDKSILRDLQPDSALYGMASASYLLGDKAEEY